MNDNMLALENHLCFAVYAASHAFTKAYKPLLAELGVTYPQYLVMLVLWEKRVATVTEIGGALGLDTGTLSPLLKRLEKTGFIRRERSKEDERQVSIQLTPSGLAKREVGTRIGAAIGNATGCGLDSLGQLLQTMKTLRHNLEEA
ncbi:MAG: MarR family transcriptional regulator [Rhizobium sp.]|nr:MarR family transcriptional regulator [Rhizobium sp.]